MPSFIDAKNLKPFIDKDLRSGLNLMPYILKTGRATSGYRAEILPMLCGVYLRARREGALTKPQLPLAAVSEILQGGLSTVGIIALIDAATGYQEVRDKLALQEILSRYISRELMKWQKRFPDEFYRELFKLKGLQYDPLPDKKPWIIGRITKDIIYERMAPGVIKELEKKNPPNEKGGRKHKHHQWLTDDIGDPKLAEQISNVMTLMKASSGSYTNFYRLLQRALPKCGDSLTLPLEYPEDKNN